MAILLIDQLKRPEKKLINEIRYQIDYSNGQKAFWDFYAMYALWYRVGSGFDEYWKGKYENPIQVPEQRKKVIDDVMDQITRQLARGLITYLKLACISELKHIVIHSNFVDFRLNLSSIKTNHKKISKDKFIEILNHTMPDVSVDLAYKLLKFRKIYQYSDSPDSDELIPDDDPDNVSSEPSPENSPELSDEPSPDDVSSEPSPEDSPELSDEPKDGDEETGPDYLGGDYEYPTGEFDPENPFNKKKHIKEELSFPKIKGIAIIQRYKDNLRRINSARSKAGMTMDDILDAYMKVPWSSGYGGKNWGEGLRSAMEASDKLNTYPTLKLIGVIDHIYDLYHNSGLILNKGPLHVPPVVLDMRARIKEIPRFIPHVSGLVKSLLINNIPYIVPSGSDIKSELEKENAIKKDGQRLPPDQENVLESMGFQWKLDSTSYVVSTVFYGKTMSGDEPQVRLIPYQVKYFSDGTIYTYDGDETEIHRFDETVDDTGAKIPAFNSAVKYLDTIKHTFRKSKIPVSSPATSTYKTPPLTQPTLTDPYKQYYSKPPPYPSSGIIPKQYSNDLPPNSKSKASYTVHQGISTLPSESIRLTIDDEANIATLGFVPKMISGQVWYVHKKVGDAIQFYPNDFAKLRFTGMAGSGAPVVTMKINDLLGWLPMKYSATLMTSPINIKPSTLPATGNKAGAMFEKYIIGAGFQWNPATGEYIDSNKNAKLILYKNTKSEIHFNNGTKLNFNNMPDLIAYLKTTYQTLSI